MSIHDFVPYPFPSDIVVNGNIYAPELNYQSTSEGTEFLLGSKYTLLRQEFQNISRSSISKNVNLMLITVGGSDKLNLTPKIIAIIDRLECDLHLDVVVGPGFNNIAQIISITKEIDIEVALHFNVSKMSELMMNSDLAISAGGSTLYELAATGTPAITLLQADNQIKVAEAMDREGVVINLGFGDLVSEEEVKKTINKLINDFSLRKRMSDKGQSLVDGQGASRVAQFILDGN